MTKSTAIALALSATFALSACKKDDGKGPSPAGDPKTAPADTKPTDTKPADTKPADTKPADPPPPPALGADWKVHTSDAGGYSIKFPGAPTEQEQTQQTPIGPLTIHIAAYDGGDRAYLVSWQKQPPTAPKDPKDVLEGQKEGMLSQFPGAKVTEQKDITLGTNPGRSMIIRMVTPDATQFTRVYVVGDHMYQIAMIGQGEGFPAEANVFLDSFALTKK
jgi:hypothetical protein